MKRKMIASLALMSISLCFCSCDKKVSVEQAQTSITETKDNNKATAQPATPEVKATTTPTAEPQKTSDPQKAPTSKPSTKNEMLMLSSKTSVKNFKNVKELTIGDTVNADFVLHSNTTLKNVTVNSVSNDGVKCTIDKKVYETAQLTSADAIHIQTYIPDTFSNLLISYKDSNGKTVNKLVSYDMTGASDTNVVLQDIDAKMIK